MKMCLECQSRQAHARGLCHNCYMRAWKRAHPGVRREYDKAYYAANREKFRGDRLRQKFGLTVEDYGRLLERQGGVCAVCRRPETSGRKKQLAVDHDRSCCPGVKSCGRCIRGLLCESCNRALGLFRDDPERLERALAYLGLSESAN